MTVFGVGLFCSSANKPPAARMISAKTLTICAKRTSGFFDFDQVGELMEFIISIGRARVCQPRVKEL